MLDPEDIDFPISDTFAKGLNEMHGWGLDMNWDYPEQDWWIESQHRWAKQEEELSPEPSENVLQSLAAAQREIRTLKSENQYILRKLFELSNKKHKNRDCF